MAGFLVKNVLKYFHYSDNTFIIALRSTLHRYLSFLSSSMLDGDLIGSSMFT